MAHVWTLTDGTTTVTFATGSAGPVIKHQPTIAEYDISESGRGGMTLSQKKTVTRTFGLLLTAASGTLLQTQVNTIEVLLNQAKERFLTGHGRKLYITQQIDGEASAWRSRVYVGNLRPGEEGYDKWYGLNLECDLRLVCDPFWEGPEAELQIASKASATPATGGKSIHNHNDSGQGNYITILGAQVTGTLPTPVKVQMENTSGGALQYANLYMATNTKSDPGNFDHTIEAEDRFANGTITVSANSSGGNYLSLTVNTTDEIYIPLTAAQVEDCGGRAFRFLLYQEVAGAGNIYMTPSIRDAAGLTDYTPGAPEVPNTGVIVDLGTFPVPAAGGDATGWGALSLFIRFRSDTSQTWLGDHIQITPVESTRLLLQRDELVANGESIVDDPIEDTIYRLSGATKYPNFIARESPVMLWPGELARVYFLNDTEPTTTMTVRMWIRPRRETV
jgi:hypothetical protein